MLKLFKKLKLYTKLVSETVKYSYQNLFVIICGLPTPKKIILLQQFYKSNFAALSVKSITGLEMPVAVSNAHILPGIVSPTSKNFN